MSTTVKDIAQASGLSLSTVIHILGGRDQRYRIETCRHVRDTARRLGYRPNSSARAMRRGRFDCVALLMSAEPDTTLVRQSALEGICDELSEHEMHLSVARLPADEFVNRAFVPKMLREWSADGLLVAFAVHIPPRMIELIENSHLPCVWMRSRREHDCVYLDEHDAARRAVDHLRGLGHQRIAYADFTFGQHGLANAHYGVRDSEAGYAEAMRADGLSPLVIREDQRVERVDRAEHFAELLAGARRPTAIIAYPSTAWPAVLAATRLGLKIPDDLSLMTLSSQLEDLAGVSLATLLAPEYAIGRQSAAMLVERIRDPRTTLPPVVLRFDLVEGNSCAPPRGGPGKKKPDRRDSSTPTDAR